jgi:hypothetical protein
MRPEGKYAIIGGILRENPHYVRLAVGVRLQMLSAPGSGRRISTRCAIPRGGYHPISFLVSCSLSLRNFR